MEQEIAIKVDSVYKDFRLPHEKVNSLKSLFTGLVKKRIKTYETQHALQDISFEVKKGEFFGIVGRNGSGKSTLLKIIAEIYQPTKGKLYKQGKLVPFIELGVGFNPELTGRENVYLNGALLGFTTKEIDALYDDIVAFAELEQFMDQKLKNYSSGMQVRLAFSVATRSEADILLVDEVLAVGDAAFQRKCFDYFKSLKKNKKTVVFVSHDMSAVEQYCDRVVMIDKSRLVFEGAADEAAVKYTRLFNEPGESDEQTQNSNRWGNGKATIKSVKAPIKLTNKKHDLVITADIQANEDIDNPVVGFVVKDSSGHHIAGTNTKIDGAETGLWGKGHIGTISWTLPNIFADGAYTVDIAILQDDSLTVCEWWESAVHFRSYEDKPSAYLASPVIVTKIGRK